ncbi:MAG: chloride channel protein, partial [Coprobacter sp.]|nr:chloride channel protein [Coprobacter sp.]
MRLYWLSLLTGVLTGVVTLPYRYVLERADGFRSYFFDRPHAWWFHLLMLGGMWVVALCIDRIVRCFPVVSGSGIPQIEGAIYGRFRFLRPGRALLATFVGGAAGIGMGLSLGREGPSVQMGGFVARLVGRWFGSDAAEQRYLYTGGASAGLSAAFSAPLASSIFIVEEVMRFDSVRITVSSLLSAVVAGGMARIVLRGNVFDGLSTVWPEGMAFWQLGVALGLFSVLLAGMGLVFNRSLLSFGLRYGLLKIGVAWKLLGVVVLTYLLGFLCSDLLAGGERFLLREGLP